MIKKKCPICGEVVEESFIRFHLIDKHEEELIDETMKFMRGEQLSMCNLNYFYNEIINGYVDKFKGV